MISHRITHFFASLSLLLIASAAHAFPGVGPILFPRSNLGPVLVIPVNVGSGSANFTVSRTPADLKKILVGNVDSVQQFFREVSYNKKNPFFWMPIVNVAPLQVRMDDVAATDLMEVALRAEKELISKYSTRYLSFFKRRVFVLSKNYPAIANGIAFPPAGSVTRSFVLDTDSNDNFESAIIHELGHNFGLAHAQEIGQRGEYGDLSDVMGVGTMQPFNSIHRIQLGYLPKKRVLDVSSNVSVNIGILEDLPDAGIQYQALKVNRPDGQKPYYVSIRNSAASVFESRITFNSFPGPSLPAEFSLHLSIHALASVTAENTQHTMLLATTKADGAGKEFFYDPFNGIRISLISHDQNSAHVEVTYSPVPAGCILADPVVDFPKQIYLPNTGSRLQETVTIQNRDSAECPDHEFVLVNGIATGFESSGFSKVLVGHGITAPLQTGFTIFSFPPIPVTSSFSIEFLLRDRFHVDFERYFLSSIDPPAVAREIYVNFLRAQGDYLNPVVTGPFSLKVSSSDMVVAFTASFDGGPLLTQDPGYLALPLDPAALGLSNGLHTVLVNATFGDGSVVTKNQSFMVSLP